MSCHKTVNNVMNTLHSLSYHPVNCLKFNLQCYLTAKAHFLCSYNCITVLVFNLAILCESSSMKLFMPINLLERNLAFDV